jgi:hypothetical protein
MSSSSNSSAPSQNNNNNDVILCCRRPSSSSRNRRGRVLPLDPFQQARRCGLRDNFPSLEQALHVKPTSRRVDADDYDDDDESDNDENDRTTSFDNDDEEISVGSYCGSSSGSLNLSIGARAALNQHARHVAKYGLDGSSSSSAASDVLVEGVDNDRNISTVADTGARCDDTATATTEFRRRRLCSAISPTLPTRCRLDEEWERLVDGDVSHISLATSTNIPSFHHHNHHHSRPRRHRRRHLRRHLLEPTWRIDADGHEAYELQAVVVSDDEEGEESSSSSIVFSSQQEVHPDDNNTSSGHHVLDESFYSQSTTDYFNSSLVWLLSTPIKNQAMQYHVVDSSRRGPGGGARGDDDKQQHHQQQEEESFTASTTQHDDDDDSDMSNTSTAILEHSQDKEGLDVRKGSCLMMLRSGGHEEDRVAAVDTSSSENHHHQDSSADSLLEVFRRDRQVIPPEVNLALDKDKNMFNYHYQNERSPSLALEEIELSRISSSGEEELYTVRSPATTAHSPNSSPITRRCFHHDSPIWKIDSQDPDDDAGSRGGGEDMLRKPISLPFLNRTTPSLLSSPIREQRQQDLDDCSSFVSSTLVELNNSTNSSGRNSSSSRSSSPSVPPGRRSSPPRYPTTTRKGPEELVAGGPRASSPVWSREPDLSALGLSPIAGRAADIAAQLLRGGAAVSHDSGSSRSSRNHSSSGCCSSSSSRASRRKMPTVRKNDNNRSINHEISYSHGISARSLTSAAQSSKAKLSLSPNSQQSRSPSFRHGIKTFSGSPSLALDGDSQIYPACCASNP